MACCCACSPTARLQLAWLAWATPFGLTAQAAPYADNRIAPLIVLAAFPLVLAVLPSRRHDTAMSASGMVR